MYMHPANFVVTVLGVAALVAALGAVIADTATGHDIKRGWFTHQAKIYKITEVPAP